MAQLSPDSEADPADIATRGALSAEARALLREGMTADGYLLALNKAGRQLDALAFLAHWLEKREAVWWGCQCVWHVFRPQPDPKIDAALQAIVAWVIEPSEKARRQCEAIANELTPALAVGALALAAFGSAGSMSLPDLPEVAPPDGLTASTVAAALQVAAADLPDPQRAQQQFVHLGLDIAHGKHLWS